MQRYRLADGAELMLDVGWLAEADQRALFEQLRRDVAWAEREIVIMGRRVMQPRLTAYVGDAGAAYRYSGVRHEPEPWPEPLVPVLARVTALVGVAFNSALLNCYRHGRDSMGFHADAERELGPEPVIASLSLGASRRFCLRHKKRKAERLDLVLPGGSLLVMNGAVQNAFRHGVPKEREAGPRINVTFRRIGRGDDYSAAMGRSFSST